MEEEEDEVMNVDNDSKKAAAAVSSPAEQLDFKRQVIIENFDGNFITTCAWCNQTKTTKKFTKTRWYLHLVRDCEVCPLKYKLHLWNESKSEEVKKIGNEKNFPSLYEENFPKSNTKKAARKPATANEGKAVSKHFKQGSLVSHSDVCDEERANRIKDKIMRFLVGCAIPINVVNSTFFLSMINELNSAFAKKMVKSDAFTRTYLPRLFCSLNEEIAALWAKQTTQYSTFGIDGLKNHSGDKVYIATVAKGANVMFDDVIEEDEGQQNAEKLFKIIDARLVKNAGGDEAAVEDMFGGVVFDNTSVNPAAGKLIREKYGKLFVLGCRTHIADLLMEDIMMIEEIKECWKKAKKISSFVRNHGRVKKAYKRLQKKYQGSTMQVTFPDTRFALMHLLLVSVRGEDAVNIELMRELVNEECWSDTSHGISEALTREFVSLVNDLAYLKQLNNLTKLSDPLAKFIHHFERTGARASWVLPGFKALEKDMEAWVADASVQLSFRTDTLNAVVQKFEARYEGLNRLSPVYSPEYLLAQILDPMTCPKLNDLPENWSSEVKAP